MKTLYDIAKVIRSKNAGTDRITFDIIFRERRYALRHIQTAVGGEAFQYGLCAVGGEAFNLSHECFNLAYHNDCDVFFQLICKISASREKTQIYLQFSEAQPNLRACEASTKVSASIVQAERNAKFYLSISEAQPNFWACKASTKISRTSRAQALCKPSASISEAQPHQNSLTSPSWLIRMMPMATGATYRKMKMTSRM